ncbi:metalloprotein [Actinobacillus seminis]|uniref:Metalloprotein n=1 Tax=Actinobacillus seminis TaxID=722 RepID=A0A263HDK0_9PAST|nr:VOC family protein [Actinobacillus seminis]OZN24989.1 metalloprotein [Actinobacillus seminis]SUU36287.1 Uncharacterized protein conserved in bacteria [Actinobacillus seminis]
MTIFNQNHPLFVKNGKSLFDFIRFEKNILQLAQAINLPLSDYEIDHLAIRVNQSKNAEDWLTALTKCGRILSDNIVNGRVIYLIELDIPLFFANRYVNIIELPFPKQQPYSKEGWEHIEVVIPFLSNESVSQWINRIDELFLWDKLSELTVKISEPKVEGEQLPNPSIAVKLRDLSSHSTCIKVHPYNIKEVIEV